MNVLESNKIKRAIVTIHGLADYYDGLDILCELVGWASFRNELYPSSEMDSWVNKYAKVPKSIFEIKEKLKKGRTKRTRLPYPLDHDRR